MGWGATECLHEFLYRYRLIWLSWSCWSRMGCLLKLQNVVCVHELMKLVKYVSLYLEYLMFEYYINSHENGKSPKLTIENLSWTRLLKLFCCSSQRKTSKYGRTELRRKKEQHKKYNTKTGRNKKYIVYTCSMNNSDSQSLTSCSAWTVNSNMYDIDLSITIAAPLVLTLSKVFEYLF